MKKVLIYKILKDENTVLDIDVIVLNFKDKTCNLYKPRYIIEGDFSFSYRDNNGRYIIENIVYDKRKIDEFEKSLRERGIYKFSIEERRTNLFGEFLPYLKEGFYIPDGLYKVKKIKIKKDKN